MQYDKSWTKDPDAVLEYTRDWADWLEDGETIASSDWIIDGGLTEDSSSHDDDSATIWLSGGTAGEDVYVTNRITTSAGRTEDRTFLIYVRER